MQVRLLVVADYHDYHVHRPEAEISKGLAKLDDFKIFIMTKAGNKHVDDFRELGIEIIDFHLTKKNDKKEIKTIREVVIEKKIEVVQLFNSRAAHAGITATKGLPVKVVLYSGLSSNVTRFDISRNLKYLHPRVDKVFCNSIGVAEHLQRQLFFKKSKTVVINKGHKVEWYTNVKRSNIRQELGISKDTFVLINVAHNRKMKGIPYLFKALNELPDNLDIYVFFAGKELDKPGIKKLVRKNKYRDKIKVLGNRSDVFEIVKDANAFILPSIYGEAITKSVIEAMSLEKACIISDIRGNYELIEDGVSGLVFKSKNYKELAENILKLYTNRELCDVYGKNARKRIENELGSKQTVEKAAKLYRELAKQLKQENS